MPLLSAHVATGLNTGTYKRVTILALGRGVNSDGTLSSNGRLRVTETLNTARDLQKRGLSVQIIWTGGKSLSQVKHNVAISGPGSEGAAMLTFAKSRHQIGDETLEQIAETESTSTIGNMARSQSRVWDGSLILVMTDELHFMYRRVWFATWLTFPGRDIEFVEVPSPRFSRKQQFAQAMSCLLTAIGMLGVPRGYARGILKRQALLEKLLLRR